MGRRKAASQCTISPWLSAKEDCKEGRFIQPGTSFFQSPKVKKLPNGALRLYLCMALDAGGKREFSFTHMSAKKYGISPSSYDRWRKKLIQEGFIEDISGAEQYAPGRFRFCFEWKGIRK